MSAVKRETERCIVVQDVGKTLSKASLFTATGVLRQRLQRVNAATDGQGYAALDVEGIADWFAATLAAFAAEADIGAIVPVAHGAAFALLRNGRLALPPMDYEAEPPAGVSESYSAQRDPFAATGSPRLPAGLNMGAQLHWLDMLHPGIVAASTIVPWAQYWAWWLSGVTAAEVTSLGCHSDLWMPMQARPSPLAAHRGWAARLAPLRRAGDVLGRIRPDLAQRTGLPSDAVVLCGLHDSNAALLASRTFPEAAGREATVLSTGTWFVAMRTPRDGAAAVTAVLPEERDCLVNVDADGRPVPSARFMGGREIEVLTGGGPRIDLATHQQALLDAVPAVLASNALVLPTFAPGSGPFPRARGGWVDEPTDPFARATAVALYAALVADASLDLIGAADRIVVEGRFAAADVFVRALAALRVDTLVLRADALDASFGALRLAAPDARPAGELRRVEPLAGDLAAYRARWRAGLRMDHAA